MQLDELRQLLDDRQATSRWLVPLGVADVDRAHQNLKDLATKARLPAELIAEICDQLTEQLPVLSDPDMALNNLERFMRSSRSALSMAALFERDREVLPTLLQVFSSSQYLSDVLVRDPGSFDLLRMSGGRPAPRAALFDELFAEVAPMTDARDVMKALRRFKHREMLRIGYGDLTLDQPLETVASQISLLAEVVVDAAVAWARAELIDSVGEPRTAEGHMARFVVLALGKLGGFELNYSSDIDLIFLFDGEGHTDGPRRQSNGEFFDALARRVLKLLTDTTDQGTAYRVDMRLRPAGQQSPLVVSRDSARRYYDTLGRTWERQAMIKARSVAGDLRLGEAFLAELEPWIYRRYLSRADITGVKALKRRIEHRAKRTGTSLTDVKTGYGGIRDIEFVIQFLQLLNGGELSAVRTGNTLEAITQLTRERCLHQAEGSLLSENYRFLRKVEHRLQMMFDLRTHRMPDSDDELRKLAVRVGFQSTDDRSALDAFRSTYEQRTSRNRQILDHLLHDAFGEQSEEDPVVDLVLDPAPSEEFIRATLGRFGFSDLDTAYDHLMELSHERLQFLSTRRCRHFLAAIAPRLLTAISKTPDPDLTLVNLSKVSDSLGGKGLLWELFSLGDAALKLYVELCSSSPFLSDILTSNPGMIDDLMDSLVLDRLPDPKWLRETLAELCHRAEDIEPILHSFKNAQQLRVGVRDILGKEDIRQTNAALSDIAEACLTQIALRQRARLEQKFGRPQVADGPRAGELCELVIVALGKFGGREPNYHSDLDVIFLYEDDGKTTGGQHGAGPTTNQHYFGELAQRIVKTTTRMGPFGRLYEVDARLRPSGRSGALATSFDEFTRYFVSGEGQLWERLALCKARAVFGSDEARAEAIRRIHEATYDPPWREENFGEIYEMRKRLEENASEFNLKRGPGGIVDIEFVVQTLQLSHQGQPLAIRATGALDALAALREAGYMTDSDHDFFAEAYRFLRNVEARLRLMNTAARHDLPKRPEELVKLARLLGYQDSDRMIAECNRVAGEVRRRFDRHFG